MFAVLDTASLADMPADLGSIERIRTMRDRPIVDTASGVTYIGLGTVNIRPMVVPCDMEPVA